MGGQRSTVVGHPARAEIHAQLKDGVPAAVVARQHQLSRQAVSRYRASHLGKADVVQADGDRGVVRGQLMQLFNETTELMRLAKDKGAPRAFLLASAEARRLLNAIDRLMDKLDPAAPAPATVNVNVEELKAVILTALVPHPKARIDVAAALEEYHDAKQPEGT